MPLSARAAFLLAGILVVSTSVYAQPAYVAVPGFVHDIVVGPNGNLWAIGDMLWRIALPGGALTSFPIIGTAIVAGPDGNLWIGGINRISKVTTSGAVIATYPLSRAPVDLVVGPDGNIWFVGTDEVYGRVTTSGVVTEYSLSGFFNSIESANGSIWLSFLFGNYVVVRIDPATGNVIATIPLPAAANSWELTPHPDGGVLASSTGSATFWVSLENAVRGSIPLSARSMVFDADGLLWFGAISSFGAFDGANTRTLTDPAPFPCPHQKEYRRVALLPDGRVAFLRTNVQAGCGNCAPCTQPDPPLIIFASAAQLSAVGVPNAPISPAALTALAVALAALAIVKLR